jgi:hypothetical protein
MRRAWLLLLLTGCRLTFLPLQPGPAQKLHRPFLSGSLQPGSQGVLAQLTLYELPYPNYLELRWYEDGKLLKALSIWAPHAGAYHAELPEPDPQGFYELFVSLGRTPMLVLEFGTPKVPPAPSD